VQQWSRMRIADREIGPGGGVYVIAELGVNHDGSVERALELTDAAADAGADAVKLQFFRADLLLSRAARLAAYQRSAGEADPVEMLRRLELPIEGMARVVERAHARRLHAIATVFSVDLVPEADALAWDAYKVASPDIIHRPLLEAMMATGRAMIVSTGASEFAEVERAVQWLRPARGRLALLQCVSAYPTPEDQAALPGILALREFGVPVGYSDHTRRVETAALAVRAGAEVLEKHLTHSCSARGPDHAASLEPDAFGRYVLLARRAHAERGADPPAIGPGFAGCLPIEDEVRRVSRQSLTAARDLAAGHVLRHDDVTIKRPGTGIEPWRLDDVLGRRLARSVEADMPIADGDLA
jgi:N,N'-diacetyllegionaminate synthase